MLLHLTPLVERKSARLLEQTGRKPNLSNVMHQAAKVRKLYLFRGQPHSSGDIPGVDRDCSRMAGGVPISCVERGNERSCEREVGTRELDVDLTQALSQLALTLVE